MTALRIASYVSPLYTPQYVAAALGLYKEHDLEVEFVKTRPGFGLAVAVQEGEADLLVGNVWFPLRFAEASDPWIPFAQINQQCRYILVARVGEQPEDFQWSQLQGRSVLVPSDAPTPWVSFREALKRKNVPFESVKAVPGYGSHDALTEFVDGVGDFLLIDCELGLDERVVELADIASVIGPIPWSVYSTAESIVRLRKPELQRFRSALGAAQRWVAEHDAQEVAALVGDYLSAYGLPTLTRIVARYKKLDLWCTTPAINREQADRWAAMMIEWGLLPDDVDVDGVLDREKVIA
jgi:NitT/TauT family transport system substrate-binding protein